MDPATIIGTVSAVLSFVDFTGKIISIIMEIRRKGKGATQDNLNFEGTVQDFEAKLTALQPKPRIGPHGPSIAGPRVDTDAEEALRQCLARCDELGKEIKLVLFKTKTSSADDHGKLSTSFRKALSKFGSRGAVESPALVEIIRASVATVLKADKMESLRAKWERCISSVNDALFRLETSKNFDILLQISHESSNHLRILQTLVEQLVVQSRRANLDSLQSFLNDYRAANSVSNREKRNQEAVLAALAFPSMESRQANVEDAIGDTFRWCISGNTVPKDHPELEISFREWLATGNGVYHFTGKPGSGKSTMMKVIANSADTETQLQVWARTDHKRLMRASFFVWKAADAHPLQNKFDGLVRSLLHQILCQAPELIREVFPTWWRPQDFSALSSNAPKLMLDSDKRALRKALATTLLTRLPNTKVFLLIDGLDEFLGSREHSEIAREIQSWCDRSNNSIKICVASREDNAFLTTFSPRQRLRLHLVTKDDVGELASRRLWAHPYFQTYPKDVSNNLIHDIVVKAEGVFLWVVLMIGEMIQLLDDKQDIQDLRKVLDSHSKELNDFLKEIIRQIPESYRDEAHAVFAVMAAITTTGFRPMSHITNHFCIFHASTIRDCLDLGVRVPELLQCQALDHEEALAQVERFQSRLPTMCKGLLEIQTPYHIGKYSTALKGHPRQYLAFVHRSVYDLFTVGDIELFGFESRASLGQRGRELLLQSIIRGAMTAPPENWSDSPAGFNFHWRKIVFGIIHYLHDMQDSSPVTESDLQLLEALEIVLLQRQGKQSEKTANATYPYGLDNLYENWHDRFPIVSIFGAAISEERIWFLSYARRSPYYEWLWSKVQWKHNMIRTCFLPRTSSGLSGLRILVELQWITLDDVETGHLAWNPPPYHVASSYKGSILSHAIIWLLEYLSNMIGSSVAENTQNYREKLEGVSWMSALTSKTAIHNVQFYWWLHPKHSLLRQHDKYGFKYGALGTSFGLKMTTTRSEPGQWIQLYGVDGVARDSVVICFIHIFGTASGRASLGEFLERYVAWVAGSAKASIDEERLSEFEEFESEKLKYRDEEDQRRGESELQQSEQRHRDTSKLIDREVNECNKLIQEIISNGEALRLSGVDELDETPDNGEKNSMDEGAVSSRGGSTEMSSSNMRETRLWEQIKEFLRAHCQATFFPSLGESLVPMILCPPMNLQSLRWVLLRLC
ncbi:hypothetical protein BD289DRAFT_230436 [Coniella lustricola]|uniref:Uncharacterized protein n=1 Tax=Coniella lustricola TaxID=2025994 RepID=A0A2T3AAD2_9PEZI|nr:hypothetical protein BD289DRAFT_230436 [Coniella lustricola]